MPVEPLTLQPLSPPLA